MSKIDAQNASGANPPNPEQQQYLMFQESLPKVNQLIFQMILNEIVPLSMNIEKELNAHVKKDIENKVSQLTLENGQTTTSHKLINELIEKSNDDEEKYNKVLARIRNIGIKIGLKVSELLIFANNPNLKFKDMDLLAIMKFICRDVWKQIFGKQIDNLKTNHRGTFYLIDSNYRPIQTFSLEEGEAKRELKLVEPFLELPVGIIKGVLSSLGYDTDEVICLATYVDKTDEPSKKGFDKAISFHVQVTNQQKT